MRHLLLAASAALALASSPLLAQRDLVATARSAGSFSTLLAALDAADLTATLRSDGPFTVFAPTDEAFAKLPDGTVESLLRPENRAQLRALLRYHVVPGRVPAATARTLDRATTVDGRDVRIRTTGRTLRINDARVISADVAASNGVIHVVDAVLMPPPRATADAGSADARATDAGASDAATARRLVDLAIARGAPLFNDGAPGATVAIYEVAARAVLALDGLPSGATRALTRGLREADRERGAREQAWTLREALDDAGRALDAQVANERRAARRMTTARRRH